jgi:hypothetical protein
VGTNDDDAETLVPTWSTIVVTVLTATREYIHPLHMRHTGGCIVPIAHHHCIECLFSSSTFEIVAIFRGALHTSSCAVVAW